VNLTNNCTKPIAKVKQPDISSIQLEIIDDIAIRKINTLIDNAVYTYEEIYETDENGDEHFTDFGQDIYNPENDEIEGILSEHPGWEPL